MINIKDALNKLSRKRPVFHSEADFQHSLAWEIHEMYPNLNIRLEKREEINGEELYLDAFIFKNSKICALELKYKTKNLDVTISNEKYHLKNQGAQDIARYDFCKDIKRLEKVLKKHPNSIGFAIFLTNDDLYWKIPRNSNTADKNFRIHNGRTLQGTLKWKEETSPGTTKGRENPIKLAGKYEIRWRYYLNLNKENEQKNGKFRYLLIEVKHNNNI